MRRVRARMPSGNRAGLSRRRFLSWLAASTAAGASASQAIASIVGHADSDLTGPQPPATDLGGALHRDPRYPRRGFAAFPTFAQTGMYGAGTYGIPDGHLLLQALQQGLRLVDTSPDYRRGESEEAVGWCVETFPEPFFVMTQLPVQDWEQTSRKTAFHRSLRRSLGRLRRGDVEALLVRNAEPGQLSDPQFRNFAQDVKASGLVRHVGASGHGPDIEKVLELALEDPLIDVILFGAHLAQFQRIPQLLRESHARGKILVAMKTREAALWNQVSGWEREGERRRHRPWNGSWDPQFSRRALRAALESTPADNALLSLRFPQDVALVTGLS